MSKIIKSIRIDENLYNLCERYLKERNNFFGLSDNFSSLVKIFFACGLYMDARILDVLDHSTFITKDKNGKMVRVKYSEEDKKRFNELLNEVYKYSQENLDPLYFEV